IQPVSILVLLVLATHAPCASGALASPAKDFVSARRHWAYQPIRKPVLPLVRERQRVQSPIDAFILARLAAKGLALSPPADRRTLMRRAYYSLIGLPPTFEEIAGFTS